MEQADLITKLMLAFISAMCMVITILGIKDWKLNNKLWKLKSHSYSRFLWRIQRVLGDIVIAYDDQEPEKLACAYIAAAELYDEILEARKNLDLPLWRVLGEKE
jgi:hypothetical protein